MRLVAALAILLSLTGCGADQVSRDIQTLVAWTVPEGVAQPYVSVTRTAKTVEASWSFDLRQPWDAYCQRLRTGLAPTYDWKSQTDTVVVFSRVLGGDAYRVTIIRTDQAMRAEFIARDF